MTSWRDWASVTVLGVAVFAVTTTEMIPLGLLPAIASDLGVSVGHAGLSVSLYGVLAGALAPIATVVSGRFDRRTVVATILLVFAAGNALSAAALGYPTFMAARLVSGLVHGLLWAIVASVAVRLVAASDAVRATAAVFSGISLALVLGVPVGATLGVLWGWRWVFAALAALCAVTTVLVCVLLPRLPSARLFGASDLLGLLSSSRLRTILWLTGAVVVGNYAGYAYLAPLLGERGVSAAAIGPLLLVYGIAGVLGNFGAGAALSRVSSARPLLLLLTGVLTVSLAMAAVVSSLSALVIVLAVWGMSYSALPVVLQTLVLRAVGDGAGEPATSIYVLVFNCSIAVGAFAGAVGVDAGGAVAPPVIGAVVAAVGVATVVFTRRPVRR